MIQNSTPRDKRQKAMEKTMVVMVFLLLVGLSQAGLTCKTDSECRRNVCILMSCKPRSTAGGPCETNSQCIKTTDTCVNNLCSSLSPAGGPCVSADKCLVPQSTCPSGFCLSPSDGACTANDQCAQASDSCIEGICKEKSDAGETCDANDGADCFVASSTCSNKVCLSPTDGACTANDQCAQASDSCVGQKCKAKGATGGTCDSNDNGDCALNYNCEGTSCVFDLSLLKWEGNNAMTTPRGGAASVAVGDFLYVFGGQTLGASGTLTKSVEMYNPNSNTWVPKAEMPVATWRHSVVAVGTDIYLIGGSNLSDNGQTNFYRYDTVMDKWTTDQDLQQLQGPIFSTAAVAVGTRIFYFGGQTGSSATSSSQSSIFYFETTMPAVGWTLFPIPFAYAVTQASAVAVGTDIYITGGINPAFTALTKTFKFDAGASPLVAAVDLNLPLTSNRRGHASFYNPTTNKIHLVGGTDPNGSKSLETLDLNASLPAWTAEPTAALNLYFTPNSGAIIGSQIYLAGILTGGNFAASSLLFVLDVSSTPKWIPTAPARIQVSRMAVAKIDSTVILGGGANQEGTRTTATTQYDIATDTWSLVSATLNPARSQMGFAVVGSQLFSVGGGSSGGGFRSTFALKSDLSSWIQRASLKGDRDRLCAASEGTKVYAFGGVDDNFDIVDAMEIFETDIGKPGYNVWTDVTETSKSPGKEPTPVEFCTAVSTGTKILIFGGATANSLPTGIIQSFDIATEMWDAPISATITPRFLLSATVLNGFVIVSGGTVDEYTPMNTVEAFNYFDGSISSLPSMPSPRFGHGSVTDGDSIIALGGQNGALIAPLQKFRIPVQ